MSVVNIGRARRAPIGLVRWTVCGCLAALLLSPLLARQSVVGQVRDAATDLPIDDVRIELKSEMSSEPLAATTDSAGRFAFPGVPPVEFSGSASKAGYLEERFVLTPSPRQIFELEILLPPASAGTQTVEVTAAPVAVDAGKASTAVTLSAGDLEEAPAPYMANIPKLVAQYVAGAVEGHDNFVHLKGNELSLHQFVDGVAFMDNPHSHFTPGFSPQMIQSVTVVTGGMDAEFGNRLGGVLDIVTKSGSTVSGGSVTVGFGSIIGRDSAAEYGVAGNKWDAYVFASGFSDGRYLNPPEEREIRDLGYGARAAAKFGYRPTDKDRLSLMLTGGGVNMQLPNIADEFLAGRDADRRTRATSLVFGWQRALSPRALLSTSYYQRYVSDRLKGTTDPITPLGSGFRRTLTNGVKADVLYHVGSHNIKAGIDLAMFSLNEDMTLDPREEEEAGEPAAPRFGGSGPPPPVLAGLAPQPVFSEAVLPGFSFRGRRRGGQGGVYVQDRFSPFRNFTVHAGIRYDRYSLVVTDDPWSPRIGLSYHIPKTGSVPRAVYNRYFVPPPLEWVQLGSALGTGSIQEAHEEEEEHEEESFPGAVRALRQHYFEVGLQQPLHPKIMLDVSGYHHQGRNSYENAELLNTRLFVPVNFDRERTWGADVSLRVKPLERIGLFGYLNYGNMTTRFFGPVSGGLPGEEGAPGEKIIPAFDQRHTGTASLVYRHARSGVTVGLGAAYGSGTATEFGPEHVEQFPDLAHASLAVDFLGPIFSGDGEEEEAERLVRLPSWKKFDFWARAPIWRSEKRVVELQFNLQNLSNRIYAIAKESETSPVQFGGRRRVSGLIRFRF